MHALNSMGLRSRESDGAPDIAGNVLRGERSSPAILNVAGYRFVTLNTLPALRDRLHRVCADSGVRGTILLAPEGINFFVAGTPAAIVVLMKTLEAEQGLAGIALKRSCSVRMPFRRLKVKIKNEIITFGVRGIDPARDPAPAIEPETLKDWLDRRDQVVLLDTRNRFEFEQGTFAGALHLGNDSFRGFAALAEALPALDRRVPIVTFCTGGIRCEKAAPLLRRLGYDTVYQLAGGILRYFDRVGSCHFSGECFVFDERVALVAELAPRGQKPLQL